MEAAHCGAAGLAPRGVVQLEVRSHGGDGRDGDLLQFKIEAVQARAPEVRQALGVEVQHDGSHSQKGKRQCREMMTSTGWQS
jgi:hypothetical protein